MFYFEDEFNIKSKFDWDVDNPEEWGVFNTSSSSLFAPICTDPAMPKKGIYFIGSRTVTRDFASKVIVQGSNALKWLFGKGHDNYKDGYLEQPYDKIERLGWLKNSRARNIKGLFENKVVANKQMYLSNLEGYYILGIEDNKNTNDSVNFRFWYFDCSRKIKHIKPLPNGIDIQSPCESCGGDMSVRQWRGDVPIVDGTLPGWATGPSGSAISYFQTGTGIFERVINAISRFKGADSPIRRIREEYELDRSATQFFYTNGDSAFEEILSHETDSNENPDLLGPRPSFFVVKIPVDGEILLKYNVTSVFITEKGTEIKNRVEPTFSLRKFSTQADAHYYNSTKDDGVVYTEFSYFGVNVELQEQWVKNGDILKFNNNAIGLKKVEEKLKRSR